MQCVTMETVIPWEKQTLQLTLLKTVFLDISLPASAVQSPDLWKNGNGSFFTQDPAHLDLQWKKQICEED